MNVSEFFGKKVISTQGKQGYVISVNAAQGRIECFICADENEKEFAVDVKNILSVGETVVYADRASEIKKATPLRLGRAGFDEKGNYLGILNDFTFTDGQLKTAKIGKKNYPAEWIIFGDVVIVKSMRRLKSDVTKEGEVILKKGTPVTQTVLDEAAAAGEYVQTTLKSL